MAGPTISSHWAVPGWETNVSNKSVFLSEIEIGTSDLQGPTALEYSFTGANYVASGNHIRTFKDI